MSDKTKPYELVIHLNTVDRFKTFADAFKELYERVNKLIQDKQLTSMGLYETIWIKKDTYNLPFSFQTCVNMAHEQGLMKDGNPTWK